LKTTMIMESHWRRIKHDYLHRFNRPRIDIVTWVLLSRVIPDAIRRMHALLQHDHRRATASWRKYFKGEWEKLSSRAENLMGNNYHTDPVKWACSCPYFLRSRFLICKHIVACYQPIVERIDFFLGITRSRTSPFWVHRQLVLRPEFRPTENQAAANIVFPDSRASENLGDFEDFEDFEDFKDSEDSEDPEDSDEGSVDFEDPEDNTSIDAAAADQDRLVELDDDTEEKLDAFETDLQRAVDIFREQRAKGNKKFLEKFMETPGGSMQKLVREIRARENQRTMPQTWGSWKYQATMYYQ
jgi:hypothetical protein